MTFKMILLILMEKQVMECDFFLWGIEYEGGEEMLKKVGIEEYMVLRVIYNTIVIVADDAMATVYVFCK